MTQLRLIAFREVSKATRGKAINRGDIIDVDDSLAGLLVASGRWAYVVPPPATQSDEQPASTQHIKGATKQSKNSRRKQK